MTEDQAAQLIAAMQQLHSDNQVALTLASAQTGYAMHTHQMICWLVYLSVIFGLAILAMLRPRKAKG